MLGWLFVIDDGGMIELVNEDVWLKGGLIWLVWGFWRGDIEEWGDINSGFGLFLKGLVGVFGEVWFKKKKKLIDYYFLKKKILFRLYYLK